MFFGCGFRENSPTFMMQQVLHSVPSPSGVRLLKNRRDDTRWRRRGPTTTVRPRTRVVRRATETVEPSGDDMTTFNGIVSGGDWEVVQRQVRAAAVEGKLTPGVLGAAYTAGRCLGFKV